MKFAVVSQNLPPYSTGQAMILFRLLKKLSPNDYCLISQIEYNPAASSVNYSGWLAGKYHRLKFAPHNEGRVPRESNSAILRLLKRMYAFRWVVHLWYIYRRAREIAEVIKREECKAVVACTDNFYDLPAGYLASRLSGVSFFAYLFDDYSYKWIDPEVNAHAQRLEPFVLKGATGIIVPNEFMRDELRSRYGVQAVIVRNACDLPQDDGDTDSRDPGDGVRIVYTGAVYQAHYDAFVNLITAIGLLKRPGVKLHIYASEPAAELMAVGIHGPVVFHKHRAIHFMPRIQKQADILFLPLALNSPYPEVIKTSAPGKMAEYLTAGRPILVHAPHDCFISWYFRKYECGVVVDRLDPTLLAETIDRVLIDADLRQRLAARACGRAQTDFDIGVARARFLNVVGSTGTELGPSSSQVAANSGQIRTESLDRGGFG